jgi:16S rRNA (cytosine1402-N4)-methyltransferase
MATTVHIPVLLASVIGHLRPAPGQVYADATAGLGGHARAIAQHLGPRGTVVLCDLDARNLAHAAANVRALQDAPRVIEHQGSFALLPQLLASHALRADTLLADLGFASTQVDDPARGLSFTHDGPLDMRLDPTAPLTCAMLVASSSEQDLARIIRDYGEERHATLVARKIVQARQRGPITTTRQLASIVHSAIASKYGPPHARTIDPATRTFQGLRIAVNDELGHLEALLESITAAAAARPSTWLAPGARVSLISFHSLEDRPIKQCFRALVTAGLGVETPKGHVEADAAERHENPRSRSAKLRTLALSTG